MIILLTGCINPDGMILTSLRDKEIRKLQYVDAIKFYLSNTKYPIVFVENSGTDISDLFQTDIKIGRLEIISFNGNQNKDKGKGYGEAEIIQYALENSKCLQAKKKQQIVKITGRLIVRNAKTICRWHRFFFPQTTTFCSINSDFTFPDSRFIIADRIFYKELLKSKEKINDLEGYYFEHALCDTLKNEKRFPFSPFLIEPQIEGISGSTGQIYLPPPSISTSFSWKYARYALSQLHRFRKQYRR